MFGEDEEILQDFLVEAGEILEQLSEQLVELEKSPEDRDLLNAIFRGFHTVKGGAGFLQLNALVDCCHITENLFDILRNGQRSVTSELMDVVLQVLDAVNTMFDEVKSGEDPKPADPLLLASLEALVDGGESAKPAAQSVEPNAAEGDISDAEFEQFLDAIGGPKAVSGDSSDGIVTTEVSPQSSEEISDDEFESLLDEIHGKGTHGVTVEEVPPAVSESSASSNEITDDEFEALLDQLHGNSAPGKNTQAQTGENKEEIKGKEPSGSKGGDLIDDDEFESLLEQLHGVGGPTGKNTASSPTANVNTPPPEKKPEAVNPQAVAPAPKKQMASAPTAAPSSAKSPKPASKEGGVTAEATVRVDTQRLDEIMNMVGELVLVRNRLMRLGNSSGDENMAHAVANLDVVTGDLQSAVMKTRMQPIKKVFGRFPRVVRDLARTLKKEITLELQGEDTDLDKNLVEALADPLVHLVRNSVDHGIEMPDEREKSGKSRVGKVILAAEQEGDHILLSITDDGAGMDPERLRQVAVEKGLYDEDAASRLSDAECFNIILMPGFSTKAVISDVSGRGVGMDVVKTKINQLNGTVVIHSELGKGSRLEIKVPLTLAIMPTLMVMLADQAFAFPLVSVNEIFHMDLSRTNVVDGQEVITVRDKALPLFYLKEWLVKGSSARDSIDSAHVVIVSVGTQRVGFVVDQLVGQEEVVIKPLGKMLQGTPGMAGATITGDGAIALILDVPSMLSRYAG
ncbi:MAG: two-component system chemotaxis sensor kinase CheA [Oceanicoccus sp.]|jgi:two-component system chemotaxis sensor kinase CheA